MPTTPANPRPSGNDEVHGSLLRFGNTQAAFVPLASESDDYPPVVIQDDPGAPLGSFLVRDSNDTAFAPQHLALVGPSGRYRIVASEHSNGTDPGSFFMSNEWRFVESDGRAVLRHGWDRAPAGSWIVERRGQGWVLWWYEPREENMGDLEEYVLVDVEVERLDGGRVESIDRVSGEGRFEGEWNEKGEWTGEGDWPGDTESAGEGAGLRGGGGRKGWGAPGGRRRGPGGRRGPWGRRGIGGGK